jgi:hypothetical protein
MLTYSEIFRVQKIVDSLETLVKIAEEGRKRELERFEKEKVQNILENCTVEFYMIAQDIRDRDLSLEHYKNIVNKDKERYHGIISRPWRNAVD